MTENLYCNVRSSLSQPQHTEFKRMLINLYSTYKLTYFQMKKNNLTGLTYEEKLALNKFKKGPIDCYLQTRQRTRYYNHGYIRLSLYGQNK